MSDLEKPLVEDETAPVKWSEVELPKIRCSEAERKLIPPGITNPFLCVFYSFWYCWTGDCYYVWAHGLWQYLTLEVSFCFVCCCCVFMIIPFVLAFCTALFPPLGLITGIWFGSSAIILWLTEAIINFAFSRGMKRVSYVEENKMKGSLFRFKFYTGIDSGKDFDLLLFCWNIFLLFCAFLFKKLCKDLLVFTLICVFCLLIVLTFGIGIFICPFIIIYILSLNFGFTAFTHGYLNRRYDTYFGMLGWCVRNHLIIFGYGFAALIIYCIPGLQIVHYYFGSVGATRFAVHFEEAKKSKENVILDVQSDPEVGVSHQQQQQQPEPAPGGEIIQDDDNDTPELFVE